MIAKQISNIILSALARTDLAFESNFLILDKILFSYPNFYLT
jgi:hypothetical protein